MTRNSDANRTCRVEAVTKEAKWSAAADIREGVFPVQSSSHVEPTAYLVRGARARVGANPP